MSEDAYGGNAAGRPLNGAPDRSRWTDFQKLVCKQAREAGWEDGLAALIAEGCSDLTMDAKATLIGANEIRGLCRIRGLPDSTAADFVLLGFTPSSASKTLMAARLNRQGLALHLWGLRRFQTAKPRRMHR